MTAAQQAAFRLLTTLPVRTVKARESAPERRRMGRPTDEERAALRVAITTLSKQGLSHRKIAERAMCSIRTVYDYLGPAGRKGKKCSLS